MSPTSYAWEGIVGFLNRLRGTPPQPWPPPGPITSWPREPLKLTTEVTAVLLDPGRQTVDVVGEGSYQGTLERVAGGRTENGALNRDHFALLLPEPSNPYDPNAVRVLIPTGGTVGYLSRENAVAYRPAIERVAAVGKLLGCRASLSGGWDRGSDDRGSFGVRLFLEDPDHVMAEIESDPDNLRPWGGGG